MMELVLELVGRVEPDLLKLTNVRLHKLRDVLIQEHGVVKFFRRGVRVMKIEDYLAAKTFFNTGDIGEKMYQLLLKTTHCRFLPYNIDKYGREHVLCVGAGYTALYEYLRGKMQNNLYIVNNRVVMILSKGLRFSRLGDTKVTAYKYDGKLLFRVYNPSR